MDGTSITRKALRGSLWALVILFLLTAVLAATVALMDASHFRGPLIRFAASRSQRQIDIAGPLEIHLFSLHPQLIARRVSIGNPPWTPPGRAAEIGRLSLVFDLPLSGQSFGIRRLEIDAATLHLVRDATGRANWQWADPTKEAGQGPPLIRSLSMRNAHVDLDDDRRQLQFEGMVSAQDLPGTGTSPPLRIEGAGHLNGRPNTFAINGDPLATASYDRPYRFTFAERSSGSHLTGRGSLSRPFDLTALYTTFEATGEDLQDIYFLTGLKMPDTGTYRLTGKLTRHGMHFDFRDLLATSGQSDMHGIVSIEASSGRSQVEADLYSQLLRLSDLGARAAGRVPTPPPKGLLPDTELRLKGLRRSDAVVTFHAHGVDIGRTSLHSVAAKLTLDHGVLSVTPLSAAFPEGKIAGRVKFNAADEVATTDLDVRITDLRLGQFDRKHTGQPPIDGLLEARLTLSGRGNSFHEQASNANGTITAVLPHGAIRTSLAELTGFDLRGLGLMLAGNKDETPVRCGVASFQVRDGTLTSESLVLDTDPVLITGSGTIHLDTEALDFTFHARPKHLRLMRVRAPVSIHGTLAHPKIGIETRTAAIQAGAAVALGVVLTPLAAVLAFVDPGLAKDADCAALLAQAKTNSTPTSAPAAVR